MSKEFSTFDDLKNRKLQQRAAILSNFYPTEIKKKDEVEKAMKNKGKLVKKIITDKTGKKTTVWVKPGEDTPADKSKKPEENKEKKEGKKEGQSDNDKLKELLTSKVQAGEDIYGVVSEHYEPSDDGESESKMIENILKLPGDKKAAIYNGLKGSGDKKESDKIDDSNKYLLHRFLDRHDFTNEELNDVDYIGDKVSNFLENHPEIDEDSWEELAREYIKTKKDNSDKKWNDISEGNVIRFSRGTVDYLGEILKVDGDKLDIRVEDSGKIIVKKFDKNDMKVYPSEPEDHMEKLLKESPNIDKKFFKDFLGKINLDDSHFIQMETLAYYKNNDDVEIGERNKKFERRFNKVFKPLFSSREDKKKVQELGVELGKVEIGRLFVKFRNGKEDAKNRMISTLENQIKESSEVTKKNEAKKKLYDSVRDWVGDEYQDKHISSVLTTLEDIGIQDRDYKFTYNSNSMIDYDNKLHAKVDELSSEIREGDWHMDLERNDINNIIYGLVRAKNQ